MKTAKSHWLAVVLAMLTLSACTPVQLTQDELNTADFGNLPSNWKSLVKAEFNRTHRLYDPGSAQYGFSDPEKSKSGKTYGYKTTLSVNAKNRMGGYTGSKVYNYFIKGTEVKAVDTFASSLYNSTNE